MFTLPESKSRIKFPFQILLFFSFLLCRINAQDPSVIYGNLCDNKYSFCSLYDNLKCSDNKKCECINIAKKVYDRKAFARCIYNSPELRKTTFGYCTPNCTDDQYCSFVDGYCKCKKPLITVLNGTNFQCKQPVLVATFQNCFIGKEAFICDEKELLFCKNSICQCLPDHYYNSAMSKCVRKDAGELIVIPFPSSKGIPGDYCDGKVKCISGLICDPYYAICKCPKECKQIPNKRSCACGPASSYNTIDKETYFRAIVGIVSCAFFVLVIAMIRNALLKRKNVLIMPVNQPYPGNIYNVNSDPPPPYSATMVNRNNCISNLNTSLPSYEEATSIQSSNVSFGLNSSSPLEASPTSSHLDNPKQKSNLPKQNLNSPFSIMPSKALKTYNSGSINKVILNTGPIFSLPEFSTTRNRLPSNPPTETLRF